MKDEINTTDVLHGKVEEMNIEVERMWKVLQAKEAVLEDVLCNINQLPKHPMNTVLIQNILKSKVKQFENSNLIGIKCYIIWSALFLENICIAIEVENDTNHTILPSCAAVCNCDLSDTTTVIFDDMLTTQHIPPESKRTLLVSFRKGLLLEGLKFYQCLYTCHFSKVLNITPSYLRIILRNIGKFREVDFGNWQLFIGETDTIWNNFAIYTNSLFMEDVSSQCRLFSKNEYDMYHFIEILDESNKSYEIT
ncbi:Uncharacterized protein BM_BM13004 [Brugia malayi]|uniref:Bm13004 n=1 Tax=Brugia malayi TaxID=6279 RepID=A0A4E9FCM5_BRUMA|nr:Uncharacterized protein BM_BM13004 [Brugia malayi]VIO92488.1 Uncharacterized protein BM_BM13004 [Brugia malayi]